MLLPRLQREHVSPVPVQILRRTHQAARHIAHELLARREQPQVWPPEVQLVAERLPLTNRDVCPERARRLEQAERDGVRARHEQRSRLVRRVRERANVLDIPVEVGVLH